MAILNSAQMGYPTGGMQQNQPAYLFGNLATSPVQYNYLDRMQSTVQNQFLKCRPVSSKEEAMASQIDLDGSLWVFPNVGSGKIYTKQINADGTAAFYTYTLTEEPIENNSSQFVTREEFNKVIQSLLAATQVKTDAQPASAELKF